VSLAIIVFLEGDIVGFGRLSPLKYRCGPISRSDPGWCRDSTFLLDQNWSLLLRSLEAEVSRLESSNRRFRLGMVVIAVAAVGSITLAMRQPEPRDPFVSLELGQGGQYMYGLTMSGQLYQMDRTTAVGVGVKPRRWFKVGDR
jgi:hypothetical protein